MKLTNHCTRVAILTFAITLLCGCETTTAYQTNQGQWYRGNTHAHSLWSDGNDFPDMIVDWYQNQGYHFLAMSDHNILMDHERWMDVATVTKRARGNDATAKYIKRFGAEWVNTREHDGKPQVRLKTLADIRPKFEKPGAFLLIEAEEITDRYARHEVHINAINLEKLIKPQHGKSVRETMRNNLQQVIAQEKEIGKPILAHQNHPNFVWSITAEDLAHVLEEDFFEVYNGHPGINHAGDQYRPGDEKMWDIANTIRLGELQAPPLYGVATDDSHYYHGGDVSPGRGWIWVRAKKLEAASLINAMREGNFYASTGVTLKDVRFDRKTRTITIEIAPDGDATFTTQFIGTPIEYDKTSKPTVDADGKEIATTRTYSSDIGKIFATQEGLKVSYKLTGEELFVRATINSSKAPINPSYENQTAQQAWTQPVGWEKHVKDRGPSRLRFDHDGDHEHEHAHNHENEGDHVNESDNDS